MCFNTPILFLIFNRPDTTQEVFNRIKQIKPQFLYIAADGPRANVPGEREKSEMVRDIVTQVDWDCNVKSLFREQNLGCKEAVSSAITWFFDNVEEGIILEDDCCPDLSFFEFCQVLLEKYRNNNKIQFIGGNYFQRKTFDDWKSSYYFSNYAHIWGWASWRRVWKQYDVDMKDYSPEASDKLFKNTFNSNSERKYWDKVFEKTSSGQINTWDYQLTYSLWKNNGISITPTKNLVINLGFQNNATHQFLEDSYKTGLKSDKMYFPLIHPNIIEIDRNADKFTFTNLYSHSLNRLVRIAFENNIFILVKYYLKSKLKKSGRR